MKAWPIDLDQAVSGLGRVLGCPLTLCEESYSEELTTGSATAFGTLLASSALTYKFLAKFLISEPDVEPRVWALVFAYLNGKRVAPPELTYMLFAYDPTVNDWIFHGWEADVYDEWSALNDLP